MSYQSGVIQPLRWKTNPFVSEAAAPAVSNEPRAAGNWNKTRIDTNVRQAKAVSDPFSDPFGDRLVQFEEPVLELNPTDAELPSLAPAAAAGAELPASHSRSVLKARQPESAAEEPLLISQPMDAEPGPDAPMPEADVIPPSRKVPCDRVYADRNCCDIDEGCRAFRQQIRNDSIRNISLDITPPFVPDVETVDDPEARRNDQLRLLQSRTWLDHNGRLVATGRMTNLANGRVIIVDDSGKEVARISLHQLGNDELCYVNAWWRLPVECAMGESHYVERNWMPSTYAWHASALCHKPLYFEEVQLERYGHTAGPIRQPFISGAHFFLNIAALPYNMAINPPHECQYALGYYRPGSCAPWMIQPVPLSLRGALAETAVIVGGIYVIP